jgi:hypothetical protein
MRCMSRSAMLLKVGIVNFIFLQLRDEGIHNSVTVLLGVESLREKKKWVRLRYHGRGLKLSKIPYFCLFFVL